MVRLIPVLDIAPYSDVSIFLFDAASNRAMLRCLANMLSEASKVAMSAAALGSCWAVE